MGKRHAFRRRSCARKQHHATITKALWVLGQMAAKGVDVTGIRIYECLFCSGGYCLGHEPVRFKALVETYSRLREVWRLASALERVLQRHGPGGGVPTLRPERPPRAGELHLLRPLPGAPGRAARRRRQLYGGVAPWLRALSVGDQAAAG
jgi:hypothetical protein